MSSYIQINPNVFDCKHCPTPCDGQSKLNYQFADDAKFSEYYEQLLIRFINENTSFSAAKTSEHHYPDVVVLKPNGELFYIEVKVQRRTFMTVEKILPESRLYLSETVALNLSDLLRYFELSKTEKVPIFIFWVLMNRPCIIGERKAQFYYRLTTELEEIWLKEADKRRFRRKSGDGDEVDGKHLGVTVNYHFSINELHQWTNEKFMLDLF